MQICGGGNVANRARLSVVVLSVHSQSCTVGAVRSVLAQPLDVELVVVNTGRGSLRRALSNELDQIRLVETPERQFAGGARNIGIASSSAAYISFLAADCQVSPGSLQRRLDLHESGANAVLSLLRPSSDENGRVSDAGWASYWVTHPRRMPETPPSRVLPYGLSYSRSVFDAIGTFPEDVRVGEDSIFNKKLAERYGRPAHHKDIVTFHRYPTTLIRSLHDQFIRGRRAVQFQRQTKGVDLDEAISDAKRSADRTQELLDSWLVDFPPYNAGGAKSLLPKLFRLREYGVKSLRYV